jgi:hypothetical protein
VRSLTADLNRYAYYGVLAVLTAGTDSGDLAVSVRDEVRDGKVKGARLLTAGRGIAAKGGGPEGLPKPQLKWPRPPTQRRQSLIWRLAK